MLRVKRGISTATRNEGGKLSATTAKKKKSAKELAAEKEIEEEGKQTAAVGSVANGTAIEPCQRTRAAAIILKSSRSYSTMTTAKAMMYAGFSEEESKNTAFQRHVHQHKKFLHWQDQQASLPAAPPVSLVAVQGGTDISPLSLSTSVDFGSNICSSKRKPPALTAIEVDQMAEAAVAFLAEGTTDTRMGSFLEEQANIADVSTSDGHFLQRKGVCSSDSRVPVDVTEGTKCSYSSYLTLSLPRLASERAGDLYAELLTSLTDALDLLWKAHRQLVLYVFPSRAQLHPRAKPVTKIWAPLPDRQTLELYVAQLWLRTGTAPHLRFYVGHSVPLQTLMSDDLLQLLRARNMDLKYDHIQASVVVTCGFLLGSYMRSFDLDHYNALLQTHPRFQAFPIAVIRKNIRFDNSRAPDPNPVLAAHVLCDASKRAQTVKLLKGQFNRCNPSDIASLPDGKFYKFIETATNPSDRPLPPSKLKTVRQAKYRQAKFLDSHETAPVLGVIELDLPVDLGQGLGLQTLRRVLMGIRTRDNWSWPLFLSIDMNAYRGEILALYHTTTRAEARAMLSFLPLFLEAQYGSCVREWFSTECLTEMEAYHWDDAANCVVETAHATDPLMDESLPFFGNGVARDWELVEDDLSVDSAPEMTFDLALHFQTQARANSAGCGFDDAQSMSTLATGTTNLTAIQYAPPQASASLGSAQTGTPLGDDAPQGGGPTVPPPAMTDALPDGVAGDGDAVKAAILLL